MFHVEQSKTNKMRNSEYNTLLFVVVVSVLVSVGMMFHASRNSKKVKSEDNTTLYMNVNTKGQVGVSPIPTYVGGAAIPMN